MKLVKLAMLVTCFWGVDLWAQSNAADPQQTQIQQILNNWRARSGIPSATLSIFLPNQDHPVTFTSGTTHYAAKGNKIKDDTLFQAGSITKSFTSAIILQLEAEGKLNINDPITKYLPQYTRWRNVTIRQLLNHTSGIFNYTDTGKFNNIRRNTPQAQFTPEQIVQLAAEHRDYFPPGRGWKYSNTNYVLAGMIIKKVKGQSEANVMNQYLHGGAKLNLANTFYLARLYTSAYLSRMAHGYSTDGHDVTADNMSWANTAGAIITTTEDLLTWWRGLFHHHILPAQQMAQMMSLVCEGNTPHCRAGQSMPHLSDKQVGKGYGLGIIQSYYGTKKIGPVWWHNGSTKGYKAIVMWYPKLNVYMALSIGRDPGYLLKPNLVPIQRILNVITADNRALAKKNPIKTPTKKGKSLT